MSLDDAEIMLRVQRGQVELFDQLVVRYRRALLRVASSKLGDVAWAEDVVQDAFLAAYAARHTYDARFSFRTWLWTILLNGCRRQLKRRSRKPNLHAASFLGGSEGDEPWFSEPADDRSGLDQLLREERQEQLVRLLEELPEVQADALRLRFFGGLKFDEIARAMQCSLNGAKMRVRKGLLRLAQRLHEEEDEAL